MARFQANLAQKSVRGAKGRPGAQRNGRDVTRVEKVAPAEQFL
jgi:hypothetical protein